MLRALFRVKDKSFQNLIVGVGFPEMVVRPLASKFNCKVGESPLLHLSFPIGAQSKSISVWNPVVDNFECKLSSWNRSYLSLGWRIALIKASLSNFPIYYVPFADASSGQEEIGSDSEGFLTGRAE